MDEQRKLLDELMGTDRDLPPDQRVGRRRKFSDQEVCKYYLCGISPFYAFKNTKSASDAYKYLGMYYDKVCDDKCKAEWEALSQEEKDQYGYEHDLKVLLGKLVADCDHRISKAEEKANMENAPTPLSDTEKEQIEGWSAEMKKLNEESDKAADEGDVDAAEVAVTRIEAVKKMKQDLERSKYPSKIVSVCQVSGVYLSSADSELRKLDHLKGKQYQGWKAIRDRLSELTAQNPPPSRSARDNGTRRNDSSREGDRDRDYRSRDRDRDYRGRDRRDRDRGFSSRDRDYRRNWDKGKDRDRGRDYHRSRSRRSRSRSRSRERDYRRM
mmetsp:Transcript_4261/g.7334  ORF Transcript_4261/g.7334 Transcript_4261/m.7334 type:complete len:326 (+) Transcript_4261:85-1062(+)